MLGYCIHDNSNKRKTSISLSKSLCFDEHVLGTVRHFEVGSCHKKRFGYTKR